MPVSRAKTAYGLLAEIEKLILAEPLRYDQEHVLHQGDEAIDVYGEDSVPKCGTVGCVAGWVVVLKRPEVSVSAAWDAAQEVLGLSSNEADDLFAGGACGDTMPQTKEHAEAGVAHIRAFREAHPFLKKVRV